MEQPGEDAANGCLGVVQGVGLLCALLWALNTAFDHAGPAPFVLLLVLAFLVGRWSTMLLATGSLPERRTRNAGCASTTAAISLGLSILPAVAAEPNAFRDLALALALTCALGILMGYLAVRSRAAVSNREEL